MATLSTMNACKNKITEVIMISNLGTIQATFNGNDLVSSIGLSA